MEYLELGCRRETFEDVDSTFRPAVVNDNPEYSEDTKRITHIEVRLKATGELLE